jgi:hypothetical protein
MELAEAVKGMLLQLVPCAVHVAANAAALWGILN